MINRESRRGFVHAGRLIAYVVVLLLAVGAFVAFKSYSRRMEETGVELAPPGRSELARYLAEQHRSAATNPGSLTITDPSQLSERLAQWLGTRKTVEELFEDRKAPAFAGARVSAVPGLGPSAQVLFKTDAAGGPDKSASLFLKKYMEAPKLDTDTSYTLETGTTGRVVVWRHLGLIYYLVGPPEPLESLRAGLGAAAPARPYPG